MEITSGIEEIQQKFLDLANEIPVRLKEILLSADSLEEEEVVSLVIGFCSMVSAQQIVLLSKMSQNIGGAAVFKSLRDLLDTGISNCLAMIISRKNESE